MAAEMEMLSGRNGLPVGAGEEGGRGVGFVVLAVGAIRLIGAGLGGLVVWLSGLSTSGQTMALLKGANQGYTYLSAYCFSVLVGWLNLYPMLHKEKLKMKGNIRANMQFFKVLEAEGKPSGLPLVGLEEEGAVGEYNRANRSLFHFLENMGSFLVCLLPAGLALPVPTFVFALLYCIGRVVHQTGYVKGYGSHAVGFGLATLAGVAVEGTVLCAGLLLIFG